MMDSTTTTDRELVELAAVAAGIHGVSHWVDNPIHRGIYVGGASYWNPLYDDAAALRLAVRLGIEIGNYHQYDRALATIGNTRGVGEFWEVGEPMAATRRAIVRAAAEIGRSQHG